MINLSYFALTLLFPVLITWNYTDPLLTAWFDKFHRRHKDKFSSKVLFLLAVLMFQIACQIGFFFQLSRFGRMFFEAATQ